MKTRIIAGVSAAVLLVGLIFYGPILLITPLIIFAACLGYREFDHMFFPKTDLFREFCVYIPLTLTILAMQKSMETGFLAFWGTFLFICIFPVLRSSVTKDYSKVSRGLVLQLMGYWYQLALLGFVLPLLKEGEDARKLLFFLCLIVFFGDSSAYFAGKFFGKHKLAETLSPKKTIEGAIGSIVGSLLVALLWIKLFGDSFTPEQNRMLFAFTPILNVFGQVGDLFESLLKRSQETKDSGNFLPGHGGILDRIDGLAFAAPAYYYFISEFWVKL